MFLNAAVLELSPSLSSPKPYQVDPTLMMPRPCSCRKLPFWSFHTAPGVMVAGAAVASVGRRTAATVAAASAASRRSGWRSRPRVRLQVIMGVITPL